MPDKELVSVLIVLEKRLTDCANAFYVDGKPAALRAAFNGWKTDIQQARAILAKLTAPSPFKP